MDLTRAKEIAECINDRSKHQRTEACKALLSHIKHYESEVYALRNTVEMQESLIRKYILNKK